MIAKTQLLTTFRAAKEDALEAEATWKAIKMAEIPSSGCPIIGIHN